MERAGPGDGGFRSLFPHGIKARAGTRTPSRNAVGLSRNRQHTRRSTMAPPSTGDGHRVSRLVRRAAPHSGRVGRGAPLALAGIFSRASSRSMRIASSWMAGSAKTRYRRWSYLWMPPPRPQRRPPHPSYWAKTSLTCSLKRPGFDAESLLTTRMYFSSSSTAPFQIHPATSPIASTHKTFPLIQLLGDSSLRAR